MEIKDFITTLEQENFFLVVENDRLLLKADRSRITDEQIQAVKSNQGIIDFIKSNKQELIAFIAEKEAVSTNKAPNISAIYRLSGLQEGMLFHGLYDTQAGAYIHQVSCDLAGLDEDIFHRSFEYVLNNHSILRTGFNYDELKIPIQYVYGSVKLPVDIQDYRGLPAHQQEQLVKEYEESDRQKGFDFTKAPLTRVALLRLTDTRYKMLWTWHHILIDGWSTPTLMVELLNTYDLLAAGKQPPAVEVDQYEDYIRFIERRNKDDEEAFWRDYLKDMSTGCLLPFIGSAMDRTKGIGAYRDEVLLLDAVLTSKVENFAHRNRVTLNTVMQGVWAYLLYRYTGNEQVTYGFTVSGRPNELSGVERKVGMYVNTLPLATTIQKGQGIVEWLQAMQQRQLSSLEYQYTALSNIRKWTGVRGDLFDSTLTFQNYPVSEMLKSHKWSLDVSNVHVRQQNNYPLSLTITMGTETDIVFSFNSTLLDAVYVQQIMAHFRYVLEQLITETAVTVDSIQLLSTEERCHILQMAGTPVADAGPDDTVLNLIGAQSKATPGNTAIVFGQYILTYQQLDERSNQLAHYLNQRGVGAGTFVPVCTDRSLDMVVAILGILKAGAAYVPVDPEYPQKRIRYILEDTKAGIAVCNKAGRNVLEGRVALADIEGDSDLLASQPLTPLPLPHPRQLAYIIYTSGSTGNPKGVMVTHAALLSYLLSAKNLYTEKGGGAGTYVHLSYTFDASLTALFVPLLCGKYMVVSEEKQTALFESETFRKHAPYDFIKLTPAHMPLLEAAVIKHGEPFFTGKLVLGGEALLYNHFRFLTERNICTKIINEYGPTEATVGCSVFIVDTCDSAAYKNNSIPIGKPLDNVQLYILDADQQLLPVGVPGELCIGGAGLAEGYMNQAALTADKFLDNPFNTAAKQKLYRTGDLARRLPDGNIEYIGRIDNQVKIRGYRIEPGEIESMLQQVGTISQAVVLARENASGDKILVAYVVPKDGYDRQTLQAGLKEMLPDYMVPAWLLEVDTMPLTNNGKIDKRALLELKPATGEKEAVLPANEREAAIMGIWQEVLELSSITTTESFFNIGGDSIIAIRVVNRLKKELGANIQLADFFEHDTIQKLSAFIDREHQDNQHEALLVSISEKINQLKAEKLALLDNADEIADIYPMSDIQKGMLFSSLLYPGMPMYHDQFVYDIKDPDFSHDLLSRAFALMVQKHSILRTQFLYNDGGEELQIVLKEVPVTITYQDVQSQKEATQRKWIRDFMAKERLYAFDLSKAPLWRAHVFKVSPERTIFLLQFHHAILDGWSRASLNTELNNTYIALKSNPDYQPSPLKSDNRNAIVEELAGKSDGGHTEFWQNELAGYKHLDIFSQDVVAEKFLRHYDAAFVDKLKEVVKDNGISLRSLLFAAYLYTLKMLTFENEVTVGLVAHNRPESEDGDKVLGCFVNTVPFRLRLDTPQVPTWRTFARKVHEQLAALKKRERTTLFEISNAAGEKSGESNSFFDTIFNFIDFHVYDHLEESRPDAAGDEKAEVDSFELTNTHLDVTTNITGNQLTVSYLLRRKLKSGISIEALHGYFDKIMNCFINSLDKQIDHTALLSTSEKDQLLNTFNNNKRHFPDDKTLPELIEAQAKRTPQAIALVYKNEQISYGQLEARSNQLAHYLCKKGVGHSTLVPVYMHRSPDMLVAILAILKAGGVYVPLDPEYPADRIAYMLESTAATNIITLGHYKAQLADAGSRNVIVLDELSNEIGAQPDSKVDTTLRPGDLAYVIFTSGSTGRPKGVMIEHIGMINHLYAKINDLGLDSTSIIAQNASHCFDISIWQFFAALITGGTTVIIDQETILDAQRFMTTIAASRVTVLEVVPSYLSLLLHLAEESRIAHLFADLRYMMVTGEAVKPQLTSRWFSLFPDIPLVNAYGPTEASDDITHYIMRAAVESDIVPIGSPVQNMQIYITDYFLNLCPPGVKGEILVAGTGVGRGYLNNAEETARVFINDPFQPGKAQRLYKTGDMGRWLVDGNIEFFGRKDNQVKVRGFRIELEEIESVIAAHPYVRDNVVLVRYTAGGDAYLSAYLVVKEGFIQDQFRAALSEKLPDYMIPAVVTRVEALALTSNGKIDRKAMMAWKEAGTAVTAGEHINPRNEVEEKLVALWQEVLGIQTVGIKDNFFELGGDSFKAIRMVSKFGKGFSVPDLYRNPTIEALAVQIMAATDTNYYLHELSPAGPGKKLSIIAVPNSAGDPVIYQKTTNALTALEKDYAFYGVHLPRPEPGVDENMRTMLQELAVAIVVEIQQRIHTPVVIYGQCNGSGLALEIARLLQEAGVVCEAVFIGAALARTKKSQEEDPRTDREIMQLLDAIDATYPASPEDQVIFFRNFKYDSMLAAASFNNMLELMKAKAYNKLNAPLYCIVGDRDPLTKNYSRRYKDWKYFAKEANLVVMKDVGHFMWRDKPEELADILFRALKKEPDASARPKYPIIFTHVPRSAGTTLVHIMKQRFSEDEQFFFYVREKAGNIREAMSEFEELPQEKRQKLKLLQGHTSFGIHRNFPSHTYVTLLRDPVERIISYYYYILRLPDHYLHKVVLNSKMKLADFVTSGLSAELDNIQTRQLSGIHPGDNGKCNRQMLETAKANLLSHYAVFGITERFDETLILMKNQFGWKFPFYTPMNTISDKPVKNQLSAETLQLIREVNAFDMELYEFAQERFGAIIDSQNGAFHKDLERFRKYNRLLQKISKPSTGNIGLNAWKLYVKWFDKD